MELVLGTLDILTFVDSTKNSQQAGLLFRKCTRKPPLCLGYLCSVVPDRAVKSCGGSDLRSDNLRW